MKKLICMFLILMLCLPSFNVFAQTDENSAAHITCSGGIGFYKAYPSDTLGTVYKKISSAESGEVCIGTTLSNDSDVTQTATVIFACYDKDFGKVLSVTSKKIELPANSSFVKVYSDPVKLDGTECVKAFLWADGIAPLEKNATTEPVAQRVIVDFEDESHVLGSAPATNNSLASRLTSRDVVVASDPELGGTRGKVAQYDLTKGSYIQFNGFLNADVGVTSLPDYYNASIEFDIFFPKGLMQTLYFNIQPTDGGGEISRRITLGDAKYTNVPGRFITSYASAGSAYTADRTTYFDQSEFYGKWHNIRIEYLPSADLTLAETAIYLDGEEASRVVGAYSKALARANRFMLGVNTTAHDGGYNFYIDNVKIGASAPAVDDVDIALDYFDKTLYSEELLSWLANLYDPESGGFYFKTNAKYTEGFYPDKESTAKQIGTVAKMLNCTSQELVNEFTPEMKAKLISFAQSYQSDEDGYWYEAPWGKYITESKKHYQTSAAEQLLKMAGGKPLYPTVTDRLEDASKGDLLSDSATLMDSSISDEERYSSKEAFFEWYQSLGWNTSLYGAGSTLLSNMGNIIAAGYFDYAFELISQNIDPETGLLGNLNRETGEFENHVVSQDSMSGTYKVMSYWGQACSFAGKTVYYEHSDNLIKNVMDIVMSDDGQYTNACHVSNAISLLGHKSTKNMSAETANELKERIPSLIYMTTKKALRHKTSDGSYTYSPGIGAGGNQGSVHAYCLADGETSGSSMMLALRQNIYNMAGEQMPALFGGKYTAADFVDMLKEVEPTQKINYATDVSYTFDDIPCGAMPQNNGFRSTGDITIADDGEGDRAICLSSPGGDRPVLLIDTGTRSGKGFVCEFDIKVTSPQVCLQFEFGSFFNSSAMLVNESGGTYRIAGKAFSNFSDYKHVRMEYTVADGVGSNKYYVDGNLVYNSTHNTNGYPDMPALENIPALQIRAGNENPFTAYIDNYEFHEIK